MLYHLGIFLIIWLAVGFVMGLKTIFIDKKFSDIESIKKKALKNSTSSADEEFLNLLFKNKLTFCCYYTLMGFFPLIADLTGTVRGFYSDLKKKFK